MLFSQRNKNRENRIEKSDLRDEVNFDEEINDGSSFLFVFKYKGMA